MNRFLFHLVRGLLLLAVGLGVGVGSGTGQTANAAPRPDYSEVRSAIQTHVPGVTAAELDEAAVRGLLEAFRDRIRLVMPEAESETAAPDLFSVQTITAGVGLVRIEKLTAGLAAAVPAEIRAAQATNEWHGLVLDLRFAAGDDYAAVAAVGDLFFTEARPLLDWGQGMISATTKSEAITLPVVVLVNGATAGAPEVLAELLRETGTALILGAPTRGAVVTGREIPLRDGMRLVVSGTPVKLGPGKEVASGGVTPDIRVNTNPAQERAHWLDPFANLNPTLASDGAGTNRVGQRPRTNEADLVRARREGVSVDSAALSPREVEPEPPVIYDPALARAVDVLKGLAVVRRLR